MSYQLEVCIDNIESLALAQQGGATRIELCAALALGGLTPSHGLMHIAAQTATVPVYAMIRPRQGDFLFSEQEVEIMLSDIHAARQAGLQGVVIGALTADGQVDRDILRSLVNAARGMGITFHRAVDLCIEPMTALEAIMAAGCERVLTSGQHASAEAGIDVLADMVKFCGDRLSVMAGAGVHAGNVREIIRKTGVKEVHLSGKTTRPSEMTHYATQAHMGSSAVDDFAIPVTDVDKIAAVAQILKTC